MLSRRSLTVAALAVLISIVSTPGHAIAAEASKILFAANSVQNDDGEKGKTRFKIYAMEEEEKGANVSRITTDDEASEFDAVYSPDGKWIAFAAVTEKREHEIPLTAIFVASADGSGRKQLTKGSQMAVTPAWSPDGKRVAYGTIGPIASHDEARKTQIVIMDSNGENAKTLGDGAFPAWSPDGNQIAYALLNAELGTLHVRPVDGGQPKELGKNRAGIMPAFSPDGKRIAYVGPPGNEESLKHPGPQIYVMNADGSDPKQVTKVEIGALGVRWSANGDRLFFCQLGIGPRGMAYLMAIDTDGKNPKRFLPIAEMNLLPGVSVFALNLGAGPVE